MAFSLYESGTASMMEVDSLEAVCRLQEARKWFWFSVCFLAAGMTILLVHFAPNGYFLLLLGGGCVIIGVLLCPGPEPAEKPDTIQTKISYVLGGTGAYLVIMALAFIVGAVP